MPRVIDRLDSLRLKAEEADEAGSANDDERDHPLFAAEAVEPVPGIRWRGGDAQPNVL
jgi:hypothetical protein